MPEGTASSLSIGRAFTTANSALSGRRQKRAGQSHRSTSFGQWPPPPPRRSPASAAERPDPRYPLRTPATRRTGLRTFGQLQRAHRARATPCGLPGSNCTRVTSIWTSPGNFRASQASTGSANAVTSCPAARKDATSGSRNDGSSWTTTTRAGIFPSIIFRNDHQLHPDDAIFVACELEPCPPRDTTRMRPNSAGHRRRATNACN